MSLKVYLDLPYYARASLYLRLADWASFDIGQPALDDPQIDRELNKNGIVGETSSYYGGFRKTVQELADKNSWPPTPPYELKNPVGRFLDVVRNNSFLLEARGNPVFQSNADRFWSYLELVDCNKCARIFHATCWKARKGELHKSNKSERVYGCCVKWLTGMIKYANALVGKYYKDVLSDCNIGYKNIHYEVEYELNKNPLFGGRVYVNASAGRPKPGKTWTKVRLQLYPGFDRVSYCTLPYILFHELFCHVYEMAGLGAEREVLPEAGCRFDEGWMDYVAKLCLFAELGNHVRLPKLMRDQTRKIALDAETCFDLRYTEGAGEAPTSRLKGADIYQEMEAAIQAFQSIFWPLDPLPFCPLPPHRRLAIMISFLVNIKADAIQRREFVQDVDCFTKYELASPLGRRCRGLLVEVLRDFLEHRDINILLSSLRERRREVLTCPIFLDHA